MKKPMFLASMMLALTMLSDHTVSAQEGEAPSKIEVGVQFSSMTLNQPSPSGGGAGFARTGNSEAGFGGRFTFNLNKHFALEAEGNFSPHENFTDPVNSGRLFQGQFGLK